MSSAAAVCCQVEKSLFHAQHSMMQWLSFASLECNLALSFSEALANVQLRKNSLNTVMSNNLKRTGRRCMLILNNTEKQEKKYKNKAVADEG